MWALCGRCVGVVWELYKTYHLGGGGGSDTREQEASEVDDNFEGDFEPLGQGDFILTHDADF